jgi:hypothetical protein
MVGFIINGEFVFLITSGDSFFWYVGFCAFLALAAVDL